MAVMKVKESKFGAPSGIYVGVFQGLAAMKDDGKPRVGRDGKPMEPGMEWQFEVTEGEFKGQIVGRITSKAPTTKNSCGQLLAGLVGHPVRPDEEIDPDHYRGQRFQIVIGPGKENPDKTQVIQIVRLAANGTAPPTPPAGPKQATPPPPPGAKPTTAPPTGPAAGVSEPHYWVWDAKTNQAERASGSQIREMVRDGKLAANVSCMSDDKSSGWKKIADFGLDRTDSGGPLQAADSTPPGPPPF